MTTGLRGVFLGVLLTSGCAVDLPEPEPISVSPTWGWNGEDTVITVVGDHFYPQVEVDATGGDRAEVNAGYQVALVREGGTPHSLSGVSLQDYGHLRAVVPAGLEPGLYDVQVEGPTGRTGIAADVFSVSSTRADRVMLDADSVVHEVFETAWVDVSLVDPDGERVLSDIEVVVVVTDDVGAVQADFQAAGLEDQEVFGTGFGIRGRLGDDGFARVGLSVGRPGTVDVTASPGAGGSGLGEGSLKLLFEPGSELALDIELPTDDFVTTAGSTFPVALTLLDQYGNPVDDREEIVVLKNACETWVEALSVQGGATVEATLRQATGTAACPEDRIEVLSGPPGASEPITVDPGPLDAFEVVVGVQEVEAGETYAAVVTPIDSYGNRTSWTGDTLTLTDSAGGVAEVDCVPGATIVCSVQSRVAAEQVVLTVEDEQGIRGASAPFAVAPGEPAVIDVEASPSPAVAGSPFPVDVWVRDAWGNAVPSAASVDDLAFTAPDDDPACTDRSGAASGATGASCTVYRATGQTALEVALPSAGLSGSSGAFAVQNGPLAQVVVTAADTATAGQGVELSLAGYDAWDNPWVVQTDPVITLDDTGGSLEVASVDAPSVALDAAGEATVMATFTRAGDTQVIASQGGSELGRSAPLTVQAGPASGLDVQVDLPWVWVGDAVPVRVDVVDGWGNRADWAGTLAIGPEQGDAPEQQVPVAEGRGSTTLTWSTPVGGERVLAEGDGELAGASASFEVVMDCAQDGPVADVSFDGHDEAVLCLDPSTGEAVLRASLSGSSPGVADLAWYGLRADGIAVTDTGPELAATLEGAGRYAVEVVVTDADGCADARPATAWVGADDGQPVGPIELVPDQGSLEVGTGSTVVFVEAVTDCARQPAAGAEVRLRADRGTLSGITATGAGLATTLDTGGDGAVTLDAGSAEVGGTATLYAWVPSGAARGETTVDLTGDLRLPTVWWWTPAGDAGGPVDTVSIGFSEPLLASQVIPDAFAISGPGSVSVISAELSSDGREVTLGLDPAADADLEAWTVQASEEPGIDDGLAYLHDLQGNKLDGLWTGEPAPWTGVFGPLAPEVDPVDTCLPDRALFRPDGDDGSGPEADTVTVDIASDSTPTWWVISVRDADGALVRREFLVPLGAVDAWSWDGRAGGRVVDNGTWQLEVDAWDGAGNRGGACSAVVTVDAAGGG